MQGALTSAWHARDGFRHGTNLKAWLSTILRNDFYSQRRRSWRQMSWDEAKADRIATPDDPQYWALELSDATRGLNELPAGQREALIGGGRRRSFLRRSRDSVRGSPWERQNFFSALIWLRILAQFALKRFRESHPENFVFASQLKAVAATFRRRILPRIASSPTSDTADAIRAVVALAGGKIGEGEFAAWLRLHINRI